MENASKALIIAGAILLSILIISLGLVIYNSASSTINNNSNLTEQEVMTFNSKITPYLGDRVTAANVNALIQTVISMNNTALNSENGSEVILDYYIGNTKKATIEVTDADADAGTAAKISVGINRVSTANTYKVEVTYGTSGLITNVKVTQNT